MSARRNISANNAAIAPHFALLPPTPRFYSGSVDKSLRNTPALGLPAIAGVLWLLLLVGLLAMSAPLWAAEAGATALGEELAQQVQQLTLEASRRAAGDARVEIAVGQLDPRLRLAPCERVQPYLPAGSKPWGKTRVGLRCVQGPTPWNVFLPVTVKVFARSLVAAGPLSAGTVLAAADLREAEVDLAAAPGAAIAQSAAAVGRTLARPLAAGDALRQTDLKVRQWFAAGDTVQLLAVGNGYSVSGEGQAMSPGLEGQAVRGRTESGRIVTGQAVGEHRVELSL